MAQLVLTAATGLAATIGKAGIGAALGRAVAGTAAAYAAGAADRLIFGPRKRRVTGPRLDAFQIQSSTEGAPVLRVYGRARVAGELIWASRFKESVAETAERAGKGGRLGTKTTTTEYLYSLSFAVGLCEGVIDRIGRVWADGKPFDLSRVTARVYRGTEDQLPDAAIEAVEGAGNAPAFRGLAYIVFEDLPLKDFGNRIPQLSFEIEKSLASADPEALENAVTAVTLIPGSGEFALGTTTVLREEREGVTAPENAHNNDGVADFSASLEQLLSSLPHLEAVSLVVSWFGTSVDAGSCEVRPGVEQEEKTTTPYEWRAGGVLREDAHLVSTIALEGGEVAPAYGGTPADRAVIEAIAALNAKGLQVMFHPFILMDAAGYPWRGRIGVGAHDKTAAAASDIAAFFGTAAPEDFAVEEGAIVYSGPEEWSFRRFILHCAHLAVLAGGVESFLLGSELRGLTTARSGASTYPAVAALKALAADVRAIVGEGVKLSYGADWSEYFGHQPADGSGDVFFHLDPLWADPEIDFVGVDVYAPRADWRDGLDHLDALAGYKGPYQRLYLDANIGGGEGFDWYYASAEDREAQARTEIADGAYGEPWVFRNKDFQSWWANAHHDRPAGVRSAAPTPWVPEGKPIRFTEVGAAAIDKGANQPNVFLDPKSAESAAPYFSSGARDDLAQRRLIEAEHAHWRSAANNPISSVYGGTMIAADRLYVYSWDARPFPYFPSRADVWGDCANWARGHWLNGRAGKAPLDLLVALLAAPAGEVDASGLEGVLSGYVLSEPVSPREAIDPLADIFQFDMVETATALSFRPRGSAPSLVLGAGDLAEREAGLLSVTQAQRTELPAAFRLAFLDEGRDFQPAVAEARDPGAEHLREIAASAPLVMSAAEASARARAILADAHVMAETASFALPPSRLGVEPGDVIHLTTDGVGRTWRILEITDAGERRLSAARVSASVYESPYGDLVFAGSPASPVFAPPVFALMDLPLLGRERNPGAPFFAAFAEPWPGAIALYCDGEGEGEGALAGLASARAVMGRLDAALPASLGSAPSGRFTAQTLRIRLMHGAFSSVSEGEILAGANLLALETEEGWEVLQFEEAGLGEDGVWTLSKLLRGQGGTERAAAAGAETGSVVVLLNAAVAEARFPFELRGQTFSWRAGPERDHPTAETYGAAEIALSARGLTPLAPAHLNAAREPEGLRLSWIRRTRIGGDSWEGEAPLAETYERYRVLVFDGETLKRTLDVAPPFSVFGAPAGGISGGIPGGISGGAAGDPSPNLLYTNEMIAADFPSGLTPEARFEIAQLSDLVGEGERGRLG